MRWKLGVGQTPSEEVAEIRAAQAAGREAEYMHAQVMRDLRELGRRAVQAETARRRARRGRMGLGP